MDTEKRFLVGEVVKIVGVEGASKDWLGFMAMVEPWPEEEEQFEDGMLHNWLMPIYARPDGYEYKKFMWPTKNLERFQ